MKFNINGLVKVKLTPDGINILAKKHKELQKRWPRCGDFKMPEIDADGYTKYQLWILMETFGDCMHMGCPMPFETTIEIEIE